MRSLLGSSILLLLSVCCQAQEFWGHTLPPNWTAEEHWPTGEVNCTSGTYKLQEGQKQTYVVGVHAPAGIQTAWREFNLTFEVYLNEVVGKRWDPPIEFKMAVTDDPLTDWIDKREEVDFMYSDTGIYSCVATEVGAKPLGTTVARLSARGKEHELDEFAGTMTVLASNHEIETIADLKGKIIGAQAFSDFAGAQAQFYSMVRNNVDFKTDPKQVIFTENNEDTILGVLDGRWDVGFVRTGQVERTIDPSTGKIIDPALLKVISPHIHVMDNGDLFPFLHSTPAFPEWPFSAKKTVNADVSEEVMLAILSFRKHYQVGKSIDTCRKAAGNDCERDLCETQPPVYFDPRARCDTTRDLAELALKAGTAGFHAGFRSAKSHFSVRTMQQDAGFIVGDDNGDWRCERADTLYDGIFCPGGHYKVPESDFDKQCDLIGSPCPEGYNCYCGPCIKAFEVSLYQLTDHNTNSTNRDSGCAKMSLCGAGAEQGDELVFRAYDNRQRANATVLALLHIGEDLIELNGLLVEPFLYEFRFSYNQVGIVILEVFFDEVQIPESPVRVQIVSRNCEADFPGKGMAPNAIGDCQCSDDTYDLGSRCLPNGTMAIIISSVSLVVAFVLGSLLLNHRRKKNDEVWHVNDEDLEFGNPVEVIGQGAFGVVLLAHYRGTKVAIKRVIPSSDRRNRMSGSVVSFGSGSGKRYGASGGNLGDLESGNRSGSIDVTAVVDDDSASSASDGLRVLDDLTRAEQKSALQRFLPFRDRSSTNASSRHTLRILGMFSQAEGSVSAKRSMFELFCPACDEARHRRSEFVTEMRMLSRLRHPCITTVMGAVMTGREPTMVMEYMENGSLYDLLRNETVYTGGDIIIQIVRDVAQGLRFLHASKPPILHRDLKAKNILIDSRFRAKVADFGLAAKTKNQRGLSGTPFWMAPEYLLQKVAYNPACDIYSFGMILYEIYSRKSPYDGENPRKILRKVCDPRVNHRPAIPATCPDKMREIMKKCWNGKSAIRPAAEDLDMLFADMSSNDVEPLIEEGNTRIRTEVASGDMLYKVFPRKVADQIKVGKKVEPESHEMVTVFFSDIVGFTDISRQLSPVKVCSMLDRLYIAFDALANKHEVFKVETIGDAWVGVTNLEGNQDDSHVRRIADFAVDAVIAAGEVWIDEDEPGLGCVHIRVGFHSGNVVSNVIGSLNPRYGLFGDTMNTASRMESNSASDRIHCSNVSAKLLREQAPEFPIRRRGKIAVKGKGSMTTYWIGGQTLDESKRSDGFDRSQRSSEPAVTFKKEGAEARSSLVGQVSSPTPSKSGKRRIKKGRRPSSSSISMDGTVRRKIRSLIPGTPTSRERKRKESFTEKKNLQFSSGGFSSIASSIDEADEELYQQTYEELKQPEKSSEMFPAPTDDFEPLKNNS